MGDGVTYFGSGKNEETTTPNVASGKRSDYPGKTNPPEYGSASNGGRDAIKVPMDAKTASSPTKRSNTESKVPQVGG